MRRLNPVLFAAAFGSVAGFVGGALAHGELLAAVGGGVVAFWSLAVGVLLVAPVAAKKAKERIWDSFQNPTEADMKGIDSLLTALATQIALRMDAEHAAPVGESKPVLGAAVRFARVFRQGLEGEIGAMKQNLDRQFEAAGGGGEESYTKRLGMVKEAARKVGRAIPEDLEAKADGIAMVMDMLGSRPGGGNGGGFETAPARRGRRKFI